MNSRIVSAVLALAIASLACGFDVNLPQSVTPAAEVKETIRVTGSTSEVTRLTLSFGAGTLNLSPGAQTLVEGLAIYNVSDLKPQIIESQGSVEIKQGSLKNIPIEKIKNQWDLKLGAAPLDLTINAGAYSGFFELGGLTLTRLTVKDGAAQVQLSFSAPNQTEMSVLQYETGASNVTLSGLANANFSTLIFSGGAGDYVLDFGGTLKRDGTVTISAGAGDVQLVIPKGVNARVTVESALVNVHFSSNWSQDGNTYFQKGSGPALTMIVKMAAGSLTITD
jgi:hypothetical protein